MKLLILLLVLAGVNAYAEVDCVATVSSADGVRESLKLKSALSEVSADIQKDLDSNTRDTLARSLAATSKDGKIKFMVNLPEDHSGSGGLSIKEEGLPRVTSGAAWAQSTEAVGVYTMALSQYDEEGAHRNLICFKRD